ncbi:MAG: fibronectin type III domain-containing protein [Microcystis sp. M38BS1]|uniref:fibronectin type III domain-containing protein n=1 Tax=Microcystis sp. M38BS1 TaxID=2771188 RepID=UPI0031FC436E|nr:fibronectin type III domain-containing protein [Microcystis sp. M38BS1]MCA6582567.1 fibronectin type III domain-containing protein [Pseudanabaena sp. M34BS1SP1A06MG]
MLIKPSTTYYYRTKAVNLDGESAYSNIVSVTTPASSSILGVTPPSPSAPIIVSTEKNSSSIRVELQKNLSNEYIKELKLDVSVNSDFSSPLYSNLTFLLGSNVVATEKETLALTIGGLTANTLYYYRLRFSNATGLSAWTSSSITTAPNFPVPDSLGTTNLTAIAARLNWGKVTGATTYFVDLATDSAFTSLILNNVDAGDVSFRDVGSLTALTQYYYRVRASDGTTTSANSNVVTFRTLHDAETYNEQFQNLATPSISNITDIYLTSFSASWNTVNLANSYSVQISTASDFSAIVQTITTKNTSVNFAGLTAATVYYVRVRAISTWQTTAYSATQVVTTLSLNTSLNPPQLLTPTTITSRSILFQWVLRSYATRYLFELSTSSVFASIAYSTIVGNVGSLLLNEGISPATTYYSRIRALNSSQSSDYSNSVTTTTSAALTSITGVTTTSITDTSAIIGWTLNGSYTDYLLSVWKTESNAYLGVNFYRNKSLGNTNTHIIDLFLEPSSNYSYTITGKTASGDTKTTAVQTFSTKAAAPILQLSKNLLTWTYNLDNLEVSTDSDFKFLLRGYPRTVTDNGSFNIENLLDSNTNYYIRGNYNGGIYSNTVSTSALAVYKGIIGKTSFSALWKRSAGATSYSVQLKVLDTGNYVPVSGFTFPKNVGDVSSYTFESLSADTQYQVLIYDSNSNVSIPYLFKTNLFSDTEEPSTASLTIPTVTLSGSADFDRASVVLSGYSKYLLNLARDSGFTLDSTYFESDANNIELLLKPNRTYYLRAYGYNGTNRTTLPSTTLTINTPAEPYTELAISSAPSITNVNILDESQVELTFSQVTNATDYTLEISRASTFTILEELSVTRNADNKFLVFGLSGVTTYYARLYAFNSTKISAYSATVTIDTTP